MNVEKVKKVFKPLLIIIVIIAISFFGYKRFISPKSQLPSSVNPKKIKTAKVKKGDIVKELVLAGKINAQNTAVLQFQTSGMLSWVGVKEGDVVKKGQAIASLDKEELKKKFQKYMNDYLTNRWNFEDTQDEYRSTKERLLVTDEIKRILERKQFSLDNAVLDVEIYNLTLKYATIYSPIDGIVTEIDSPLAGVNTTPSGSNFTIVDPSSIYFKSEIDEEDVINVSVGQESTITIDSYSEENIPSKIESISFVPVEGQTSTVYKIKFNLGSSNNNLKYRIGMNGDARIKLAQSKETLLIPIGALYEEKGKKYVYLSGENPANAKKQEVKTGIENDDEIEILEGLSEGQKIIVNGN